MSGTIHSMEHSEYSFELSNEGHVILEGQFYVIIDGEEFPLSHSLLAEKAVPHQIPVVDLDSSTDELESASGIPAVTQRMKFTSKLTILLKAEIITSEEGFAAEMGRGAQQRFPLIRNTVGGPSDNLRNDCVYDRKRDWVVNATSENASARIAPIRDGSSERRFSLEITGNSIEIDFRPDYYRVHKNIQFFQPWTYKIWPNSVCGWCSWWPYRMEISEDVVAQVSDIFSEKLKDFGYEYIQIDDGYQKNSSGTPDAWLNTNQERFPGGLSHLAEIIRSRGLRPALWVNVHFVDQPTLDSHPEWFVKGADGEAHQGPWIDYGLDGSVEEAVDTIVRPVHRELASQGWDYIKVDTLRHLLYDSYYPCRDYFETRNVALEEAFRSYLKAIRDEHGPDIYILACWGVLPEVVGIADGCRLGGDGFGPTTLIQYNSWNNVVWRNDPDHMDITPEGEEWIRPAMVTMAGAQMLLTDRVEVYADDEKIEGAKRCAPVLFTTPGQLYDYDPTKTDNVIAGKRNENGGGGEGPIDADQGGKYCEWWLMEINRPFDRWHVLARMDYRDLPETEVSFSDLGLPSEKEYLVFEYRKAEFLGVFEDSFIAGAQKAKDVSVYAIRESLGRPQLLATSRHITCGGPDIEGLKYECGIMSGASRLVADDLYHIYLYLPASYTLGEMKADGAQLVKAHTDGQAAVITLLSDKTCTANWTVEFVGE